MTVAMTSQIFVVSDDDSRKMTMTDRRVGGSDPTRRSVEIQVDQYWNSGVGLPPAASKMVLFKAVLVDSLRSLLTKGQWSNHYGFVVGSILNRELASMGWYRGGGGESVGLSRSSPQLIHNPLRLFAWLTTPMSQKLVEQLRLLIYRGCE